MQCDICGCYDIEQVIIPIFVCTGDIVRVCRDGHFEGNAIDAHIGLLMAMYGPKPLDALIYFPEGYVPSLKHKLWNMKPPVWTEEAAY